MRADILLSGTRRMTRVELPEIGEGVAVNVRALSLPEYEKLLAEVEQSEDISATEAAAKQLEVYACNESAEPVFTLEQARQFVTKHELWLAKRIIGAAKLLNSLSQEAVENARGNSEGSHTEES